MWVVEWKGFLSIPSAKEGLLLFRNQNSKRFWRKPRSHKLSMGSLAQYLLQLDQKTFQVKACFYIHWKRGLCLPGYGSWDNCGIKISRRKWNTGANAISFKAIYFLYIHIRISGFFFNFYFILTLPYERSRRYCKFLEGFYFWIMLLEEQQPEISIKGIPMVTLAYKR